MTRPVLVLSSVLLVAAAGCIAIVLARREGVPPITFVSELAPDPTAPTRTEGPLQRPIAETLSPTATRSTEDAALRPPDIALNSGPLDWEQKLAAAKASTSDSSGRASVIFAKLSSLPDEALATATQQAVEQLPDADYLGIAAPLITNPKTSGQVTGVLFSDLMERPDFITLPTLLAIARDPSHPFAPAARENLRLLLGTDESKWPAAAQSALAKERR
ncbi:MAG: hypothetical protein WCF18_02250 [Chthoniobacteraceae bacterium]